MIVPDGPPNQIIGQEFWDETFTVDETPREYLFCTFRGCVIKKRGPSKWKFIDCKFERTTFDGFHPSEFDERFVQ